MGAAGSPPSLLSETPAMGEAGPPGARPTATPAQPVTHTHLVLATHNVLKKKESFFGFSWPGRAPDGPGPGGASVAGKLGDTGAQRH